MKTLQWAAAVLAVGALALPARAETTATTDWWDVTFEDGSFQDGFEGLTVGELGSLTNDERLASVTQPYASGVWSMIDGDESYVTNEYNPTGSFGQDYCIKLDTQGNDLTWTPTGAVTKLSYLVDADLYLVGSDSAPDATDFDANSDVQAAIYLKNETDEDTGETTNSVLCVYVFDEVGLNNYWQELKGVELEDNAWAHIQVTVDHSGTKPLVRVFVNGTQMTARNGTEDFWVTANRGDSFTAGKVSSVSFRGTGAVDNFVGRTLTEKPFNFTAEVYINDVLQDVALAGNGTRVVSALAGADRAAPFPFFMIDNYDESTGEATYALARIEILDAATGATTATYNYTYDGENITATSDVDDSANLEFTVDAEGYPDGGFTVTASTAGATADATIVKIYFEDLPEEGTYFAIATTTVGETTTPDSKKVRPSEFEGGATKTIEWTFPAVKNGNVLSTLRVSNGAEFAYADRTATVSVTLDEPLDANTTFAEATYVEGSLLDGQDLRYTEQDGLYTFEAYVPPVAIIVAAAEPNEYPSLRAAIAAAQSGDTIQLVANDAVSFTAENPEIEINKNITIDGGSNTLYGVTDFSGGFHDIFISAGNVTIKDLKITEFGDTAPFNRDTYPIWTAGAYDGELVLDGVTIDKFVRTAVNLGGGTVLITNCTFTADPTAYFQTGVETLDADVTVVDTTITGVNSTITGEDPDAAAVFTLNGYGEYTGSGTITVLSGDYSGQFIVAVNPNATGSAILSNGTFVATAPAEDEGQPLSAFLVDGLAATIEVAGGWYDREPAGYVANGLTAVQDADNAPDPAATWTVKAAAVQIEGDATKSYLSIAEAQAAAATAGIDDPVFVVVAPLSAETVTLATAEDTLTVKTDDTGFLANLEVVTSLAGSDAVEYAVEPRTVGLEPPITVTYMVVPTYYVAKIVDGATTNRYETFAAAAEDAAAADATLTVEMVASTNAVEIYGLPADYVLMVKKNGFLVPAVDSASRGHYVDESPADETGVTTYSSQPYLTATFLNGDGSVLETVSLLKAGDTPVPEHDDEVEPYPPAEPGYWVTHLYNWSPALGPIYTNTTFHPLFTTNVTQYSIQYVLDGGDWPAGYTPPEWYAVTNATIELPSPAKDGWTFNGWYTNKTEGVYVGDLVNPGTIPAGSYGPKFFYASWTESSVTPDPVDPGDSLTAADKANGDLPIAVTDAGFVVKFRSKQPGVTYQLVYSTSLTVADWTACPTTGNAEVSPATASDENPELIVLTAPIGTDTVKFFKIKATK